VCKRKHCLEVIVLGRTFLLQAAYAVAHPFPPLTQGAQLTTRMHAGTTESGTSGPRSCGRRWGG
jgi:hypothetical protein